MAETEDSMRWLACCVSALLTDRRLDEDCRKLVATAVLEGDCPADFQIAAAAAHDVLLMTSEPTRQSVVDLVVAFQHIQRRSRFTLIQGGASSEQQQGGE